MTNQLTQKVLDTCAALACCTEISGQITRPYLCPSALQVHEQLRGWAAALGMTTRVDAVGNLRSRLESKTPQAFLQRVLVKSANEDFDPRVLPACFAKLRPPAGDFYQRGIILTDDHYGVQCLRKREQGADYWGVWVFFDR